MLDLYRGEVYRLFHKRNMFIYLGLVILGFLGIHFMRSSGYAADSVVTDAGNLFSFLPALLGGYFFASLYTDDLTAKNLITLVGYGTSRTKIILTKLLLMITFTAAGFAIFTALHLGVYAVLGIGAQGLALRMVLAIAFQQFLLTIGFALIASVVVYGTQKPTYAVVTFFMLAFNVVTMLVRMVESMAHVDLSAHLLSGTTSALMLGMVSPGTNVVAPVLEFVAYLALAIAASIFVFKKREMEF